VVTILGTGEPCSRFDARNRQNDRTLFDQRQRPRLTPIIYAFLHGSLAYWNNCKFEAKKSPETMTYLSRRFDLYWRFCRKFESGNAHGHEGPFRRFIVPVPAVLVLPQHPQRQHELISQNRSQTGISWENQAVCCLQHLFLPTIGYYR
jgi:hypothetical protein